MDIPSSQLGSDGHAKAVKTRIRLAVFHADTFEEIKPSLLGAIWADVGLRYGVVNHNPEKRDQLVVEPGYVCLAALCSECDSAILDVDVAYRVQISFRQPAPLVASNLEADTQEAANRLPLLRDFLADQCYVVLTKRGFDFTGNALQPKLTAWIGGSVTTHHRLLHNKPQGFQFEQGGIMSSRIFAKTFIVGFAPFDVGMTIFPPESAGNEDVALVQEHKERAPRNCIAAMTLRLVGVAFLQEFWNPNGPTFRVENPLVAPLGKSPLVDQFAGTPAIRPDTVTQTGGLPPNVASGSAEFNPPVRGILSPVDARHVSPNVTL